MHPNPTFRKSTRAQKLEFAQDRGFGILSVNGADGPLASHIPFVIDDARQAIDAHLVRSNPIVKTLAEQGEIAAVLMVSGPDGYVSPDWYGVEDNVPTWNYVAVHLRGRLELRPQASLISHLEALSHQFERRLAPKPEWLLSKVDDAVFERMARAIVPVRLRFDLVDATFKLSQNKDAPVRLRAAEALAGNLGQEIAALSRLMANTTD